MTTEVNRDARRARVDARIRIAKKLLHLDEPQLNAVELVVDAHIARQREDEPEPGGLRVDDRVREVGNPDRTGRVSAVDNRGDWFPYFVEWDDCVDTWHRADEIEPDTSPSSAPPRAEHRKESPPPCDPRGDTSDPARSGDGITPPAPGSSSGAAPSGVHVGSRVRLVYQLDGYTEDGRAVISVAGPDGGTWTVAAASIEEVG